MDDDNKHASSYSENDDDDLTSAGSGGELSILNIEGKKAAPRTLGEGGRTFTHLSFTASRITILGVFVIIRPGDFIFDILIYCLLHEIAAY